MDRKYRVATTVVSNIDNGHIMDSWVYKDTKKSKHEHEHPDGTSCQEMHEAKTKSKTYVVGFGYPLHSDVDYDNRMITRSTTVTEEQVYPEPQYIPKHSKYIHSTYRQSNLESPQSTRVRTFHYHTAHDDASTHRHAGSISNKSAIHSHDRRDDSPMRYRPTESMIKTTTYTQDIPYTTDIHESTVSRYDASDRPNRYQLDRTTTIESRYR